ncbi:hypothetical protein [Streptomyces albipurpureus]|uniref:Uncharacterized protein n=1 Tax=Streptomyces albipurpureus TaxID=2897419 RepID=A0ABT0V2F7_9ACTN|nr:hypothetical protein [Streptomyces sp. CWNU-1]MCM2394389.1 hypothetical protein [Streptomyces sp. CWNU-1]
MTMTPEHPTVTDPAAPGEDWWDYPHGAPTDTDPDSAAGKGGCCAACPIAAGCALASDSYVTCPVTGAAPPPAPPVRIPAQHTGDDTGPEMVDDTGSDGRGVDLAEVAGRGIEAAASAAFGFGWLDLVVGIAQRGNATDADGNPVDWGRLQLKRNSLCALVVSLVPIGDGGPAALRVAEFITDHGIGAAIYPVGTVLAFGLPVYFGQYVPGLAGALCRGTARAAVVVGRGLWRFATSRMGWVLTRPLIWAAVCGVLIVSWRFLVHVLTGA